MSPIANNCPCCGSSLLRHVRHGQLYWFCKTCWQEVPLLDGDSVPSIETLPSIETVSNVALTAKKTVTP